MDRTVLLLGAGASKEAGIKLTRELTRAVVEGCVREAALSKRSRRESLERERDDHASSADRDPASAGEWEAWLQLHPPEPVEPVEHPDALEYVYRELVAHAVRLPGSDLDPVIDLEELVTVLEQLAARDRHGLGAFVREWKPTLLRLDHQGGGSITGFAVERYDLCLWNFVEKVLEERLTLGSGAAFVTARSRVIRELPKHLHVPPGKTCSHLNPIGEWARREGPGTVATLNFDRTVETMAESASIVCSDGLGSW